MELWTEYEGITVDGIFPLIKLLQSKGRSASFSTRNSKGSSTVIRLIECHLDDDKILASWDRIKTLNHPNILKVEDFGRVIIDDTSVVYAVTEPVDSSIEELMSQQRLAVPEIRKMAIGLVAALDTLHTHGFFHGYVEPANVLTVGEVVKLQSDCIREAPVRERGRDLQKRDLHDFAVLLLQALTQEQAREAAAGKLLLPAPFHRIVQSGMSGEWSAAEMTAALETMTEISETFHEFALPESNAATALEPVAEKPDTPLAGPLSKTISAPVQANPPLDIATSRAAGTSSFADFLRLLIRSEMRLNLPPIRWTVAIQLVMMLFLCLGWYLLHRRPANQNNFQQKTYAAVSVATAGKAVPAITTTTTPVTASAPVPAATSTTTPAVSVPEKPVKTLPLQSNTAVEIHPQWRVIVYRCDDEREARSRAARMAQKYPNLLPEVFTPSGHAPYLVTIGGSMKRLQALALVKKARRNGLPTDTYAYYIGKRHKHHVKHLQARTA